MKWLVHFVVLVPCIGLDHVLTTTHALLQACVSVIESI